MVVLLGLSRGGAEFFQVVQPHSNLDATQLLTEGQIFFRLFRLLPQRLHLQFQLRDLVADAQKIVLRRGQAALRFLLAVAVFGNAGSFLEDLPAVGAFQGKDLVDTALADVGIALTAQARVHKQLVDIAQAHGLPVDVEFTLAAAVIAAGDHQLVGIILQRPV